MTALVDRNRINRLEIDVRRLVQGQQPRQIGETAPPAAGGDHGALTGLADDDHPQYHNDARGDARYDAIGTAAAAVAAHEGLADPHPTYLTAAEGAAAFDALGAAAAAQAASQPIDSDLTAIAALSTTTFGRALLALVGSADMTSTAFAGLPAGALAPTPQEVVVKQSGAWVRLAWADFLSVINGVASLDFSQASNSQYIGAVHI